jgi:hypothetical protein
VWRDSDGLADHCRGACTRGGRSPWRIEAGQGNSTGGSQNHSVAVRVCAADSDTGQRRFRLTEFSLPDCLLSGLELLSEFALRKLSESSLVWLIGRSEPGIFGHFISYRSPSLTTPSCGVYQPRTTVSIDLTIQRLILIKESCGLLLLALLEWIQKLGPH